MLGMCVQKVIKTAIVLIFTGAFFGGCEAMDTLLPSAGHYRVNLQVNNVSLDECSFIRYSDKIHPFFEEPVSDDKDVTALMVFLKNSAGEVTGRKVSYSINSDNSADMVFPVDSLDNDMPSFPIPANLPMGKYTLVFQVMSGKDILQRTEKTFYYLSGNNFSFSGINIHIPGVVESPLIIPKDTNVMLEAALDFNNRLNPYIIWYDGKNKISEGKISDGAGILFWQAPEQSGFFSLRAEVFPIENIKDLSGYQNEVSVLVSSKAKDFDLISEDIPQLIHWYTFEGNFNNSKAASEERALKSVSKNIPAWKGVNGTYGLVTGQEAALSLPNILIPSSGSRIWQTLFRLKFLDDGVIFSVFFGRSNDVHMSLLKEGQSLVLVLQSPLETVSQVLNLPVINVDESGLEIEEPFFTAGINFSIMQNQISAQINIMGVTIENELNAKPILLKTPVEDKFQIILGFTGGSKEITEESPAENLPELDKTFTALWDEFALYYMPPIETIIAKLRPMVNEY